MTRHQYATSELRLLEKRGDVSKCQLFSQATKNYHLNRQWQAAWQVLLLYIRLTMKNLIGREHSINSQLDMINAISAADIAFIMSGTQVCAPWVRTNEEISKGTFHLHGKPEIPVWKSNGSCDSVWEASENMGSDLGRINFSALFSQLFSWCWYTLWWFVLLLVKFYSFMFMHKISTQLVFCKWYY